jgi:hypothetical protein
MSTPDSSPLRGVHAILGMDIVGFSKLDEEPQLQTAQLLFEWLRRALQFYGIDPGACCWSPGGDGGHLTFPAEVEGSRALDVAFRVVEQVLERNSHQSPPLYVRFGLHSGTVHESAEFRGGTNVWGHGINEAARIKDLAAPNQVLISGAYFDAFIKSRPSATRYDFGQPYQHTVKHGRPLEVRNVYRNQLGLDEEHALALRWSRVGELWQNARRDYEFLIGDAMHSDDVVAALAAAKCLLDLGGNDTAGELFAAISNTDPDAPTRYARRQHVFFSKMPPAVLGRLLQGTTFRSLRPEEVLFHEGEVSDSVFFPVSGRVEVVWNGRPNAPIPRGQILGETALWISEIRRTGTVRAAVETLLLEVRYPVFQSLIDQYPHLGEEIYGTIKQRMLKNAIDHPGFFPPLIPEQKETLAQKPSGCVKVPAGWSLDLRQTTYLLFSGKVQLSPQGQALELSARGYFDAQNIFGLVTEVGTIDGEQALVLEDSVCVAFPHEVLLRLQRESEAMQRRWWELFGHRSVKIQMLRRGSRGPGGRTAP